MQDPVEELAELREQTDVVAQVDERARRRMEPVEAVDESGEVTVRLRPSAQSAFDDVANETSDFGAGGWPRAVI